MKIVQSFWSKPGIGNTSWVTKNMHYFSWALSCLKLKQYYNEVELVTDKKGKEILIDILSLPYDSVKVVLDDLNDYDSRLWALGKIYAYSIQDKPFIHVDGDVFIWDRFPDRFLKADLIAQNKEEDYEFAETHFKELLTANIDYIPNDINIFRKEVTTNIIEVNAGILGGNDLFFIKDYCKEAFNFVEMSMKKALSVEHSGMFNTVFEQYLFYCMACTNNKNIEYYFQEKIDSKFEPLVKFMDVPFSSKFVHVLSFHKANSFYNQKIMHHLWYEFPDYYYKIVNLLSK